MPCVKLNLPYLLPHFGSGLSRVFLVKGTVIKNAGMHRPTFENLAVEEHWLKSLVCCQATCKQYQRGGLTWRQGFCFVFYLSQLGGSPQSL